MRCFLLLSLAFSASLVIAYPRASLAQSARPDLAGSWVLNRELSDDLEAFEREADHGVPKALGSGGRVTVGVRPRQPVWGGGEFGRPRGFDPEVQREAVAILSHPAERLSVILNADTVSLALADRAPYALIVDGKKARRAWRDGLQTEIRASWKDGQLRVERKQENQLKITESYTLDPESQRLVVITTAEEAIPRKLEVRYVYERVGGS